jgi:hypothetical protein
MKRGHSVGLISSHGSGYRKQNTAKKQRDHITSEDDHNLKPIIPYYDPQLGKVVIPCK